MSAPIPDLERVVFFSGQRLAASDLTAMQVRQRELRWLHNRSLHAWGIATGLAVAGGRGDTAVRVGPGYGTDALGREISLTEARTLDVPAVAAASSGGGEAVFFLVARYVPDGQQDVLETRETACHPSGAVRLGDEASLEWRRDDQLDEGSELILAKAWVRNCRLSRDLSARERRESRPSATPYVSAGQTRVGQTDWTPWEAGGQMLGVQVEVRTTAAHFRGTPRYLAHVIGERFLPEAPGPLVALGVPSVTAATADRFTLQILIPKITGAGNPPVNPNALRNPATGPAIVRDALRWSVAWTGIEV